MNLKCSGLQAVDLWAQRSSHMATHGSSSNSNSTGVIAAAAATATATAPG
jgi:hypothetical protein